MARYTYAHEGREAIRRSAEKAAADEIAEALALTEAEDRVNRFADIVVPEIREGLRDAALSNLRWMHGESLSPVSLTFVAEGNSWILGRDGSIVAYGVAS